MSQHPSGLDLFDEKASAVRGFSTVMRGYEKKSVDDYIRDIEQQVAQLKHQLRQAQQELTAANLRHDDTDYGKLGAHTASMLKVAESQATELVTKAESQADMIRAQAQEEADSLKTERERSHHEQRAFGIAELQGLRAELEAQTKRELEATQAEALGLRQSADQHRSMVIAGAETQASALIAAARTEAAQLVAAAQADADAIRAEVARHRQESLAALASEQACLRDELASLMADARSESDALQDTLAQAAADLRTRQQAALADAESLKAGAITEAAALLDRVKAEAEAHRVETETALISRSEELQREQNLLKQRKEALIAQLSNLSSLANMSALEFPDQDGNHPISAELIGIEDAELQPERATGNEPHADHAEEHEAEEHGAEDPEEESR